MSEIVKATWRLPADLHRRIEALAHRSRRSMNQQVVYLLETHPEVVEMETKRQFRVDPMDDPFGLMEPDYSAGVAGATKAIYLALDTRDGSVWLGTRAQADNAVPMEVWHGIVRRYYLPANVDAQQLTQDINSGAFDDLMRRIVSGSEVVWDGQNHVCRMTDDAYAADQELSKRLQEYPHTHEGAMPARDWLWEAYANGDLGLTAETTDEELEALAERWEQEARDAGICLLGTIETLTEWRDELRERAADAPPPVAGGSQLAEQREAVLFIHAEDPADKMPRFRTVVRVYEDGTARAEEQLQYQYEHRGKVVTVWQTIDRPDGSDVLSPETVARYIKTAADLGIISRQAADEAVEQIRQGRPVPIDYTTSKGSYIDSSTTTVGDVEYALQHLGAKVGRRTPEGYVEDPNGDLIWWSGGDWPNPHCAVPLQRFLEAGGHLPA